MSKNDCVSIIVPVYGAEAYLPACIDSLCNQSYPHIQIILVDDQSPDRCPQICDTFAKKDSRVIVIHQENKGVSGARNTGLRYVAGKYIMFVDSDDLLYPNAVELLLEDAYVHNADIVSATKEIVDQAGKTVSIYDDGECSVFRDDQPILLSLAGDRNTNSVCAKLFDASFIQGIYFEEGKNINEDGFFLFQCYARKPILVQHDTPVYQYNAREGSNSRQIFSDKYLSMLYYCDRKKQIILNEYPQYIEQMRSMEVRTHLQFLQVLCRTTDQKYKKVQNQSIQAVCRLYQYHRPINEHHKKLAWIVTHGLYPLYKLAVRIKYYS